MPRPSEGAGLSPCILQHVTVGNSSHNLFTPYKHLLPSLRQLFCCQKEEGGKKKQLSDAGPPHSPSPTRPPSCILQSASISATPGLVTSLHLISPLTPTDPGVASSTRGNAHRSSGNYPVGLEVARPKGTKPQSAVSPRRHRRCCHRRRPQWQRQ